MGNTKIAWAEKTWSPITGCTPISPGCANCYAKRMANRLKGRFGYDKDEPFRVTLHGNKLAEPSRWKKPSRVFVCSMGDIFHNEVNTRWIDAILAGIDACPQHQFLMLTKRAENLQQKLYEPTEGNFCRELGGGDYLPNLWLGVSCENQEWADKRIPLLLEIPAAVRFLSLEPMLDKIDISLWLGSNNVSAPYEQSEGVGWVVAGCESGPGRRPCKLEWVRDVVEQCQNAGVPVFVKQIEVNGKVSHDMSQWPEALRVQEYPVPQTKGE